MFSFLGGPSQAPQAPRSHRSPRSPRSPRAPQAPLASWRAPRASQAPRARRAPRAPTTTIEYYTGPGKASDKPIKFLNELSQLNYLFPSLVETEFIEPEFKSRKNINFNILNKSPTLEFAKQVAKNYYLWLQVFDVSPGAIPQNVRKFLSEFLGLRTTNRNNIYQFNTYKSEMRDFILLGLQQMFPNKFREFKVNEILAKNIEGEIRNVTNMDTPESNLKYYEIDKIGRLIEYLVVTEFARYFNVDQDKINTAFVDNKYNINATYYYLESIKSLSAGGQYYRKRKTRKPKKTRKPRKTQRK